MRFIREHMGDELFWGKLWACITHLEFKILRIEGRDAQEYAMFYLPPPQKKRHVISQIHLENKRNACLVHLMGTTQ